MSRSVIGHDGPVSGCVNALSIRLYILIGTDRNKYACATLSYPLNLFEIHFLHVFLIPKWLNNFRPRQSENQRCTFQREIILRIRVTGRRTFFQPCPKRSALITPQIKKKTNRHVSIILGTYSFFGVMQTRSEVRFHSNCT